VHVAAFALPARRLQVGGLCSSAPASRHFRIGAALAYGGHVIVTCPQCTARYRLAIDVVMRRPKLKCADCGLRWVPDEEIDEDEAVAAVQEEVRAARNPPPPSPQPPNVMAQPDAGQIRWGKWLLAMVLGTAFTTASVGLWIGRIAPEALPGVGDVLAHVAPPPSRLDVNVSARVTRLPGGGAILEVTGRIANPGRATVAVPPLNASLMAGGLAVRDWTIQPPAATIAAGQSLAFASTLTDVPAGPVTVQMRFARNRL
jgi:hypothetical protein